MRVPGWLTGPRAGERTQGVPILTVIAAAAVLASWTGTLPGRSVPIYGPLVQGLFWAGLCAGLALAYGAVAPDQGGALRRVLPRVGACLLLALLATHLSRLLLGAFIGRGVWQRFFYLEWLVPPACAALACAALMPRVTRAIYRAARGSPRAASLLALLVLLVSAGVLTAAADLTFEWGGVDARLRREVVMVDAWVTNTLLLFSALVLVFAVTRRVAIALLLVAPSFLLLDLATIAKIEYMHSAVQPLDVLRVAEFVPLFRRFFGTTVLLMIVVAAGLWVVALVAAHRTEPWRLSLPRRLLLGVASLVALITLPLVFYLAPTQPLAGRLLLLVGAPGDLHREKARANGLLLSFVSEIPALLVPSPVGYSPESVATAMGRTWGTGSSVQRPPGHVNLILYLVESFMDPDDLGLHYTSDPIPNVRALGKTHIYGHGIVPERFGGSANTEFELLTGMTMSFLPIGSLPFKQHIRHPMPSLPRALADLGYATTAIQADAKYYYNRERVYDLLGFHHVVWLNDMPGVERAARPGWPSDNAVVQSVIQASRGPRPFFVFAFPSSTHSPYNSGTYRSSDLGVLGAKSDDPMGEVKEYINAIREADRAIGTLVEYFRGQRDSTIIAILGDHMAPLSGNALRPLFAQLAGRSEAEQARRTRRGPLVVWANFQLPREETELSVNALPAYLLQTMRIPPPGFLGVGDRVRRRIPVLGRYMRGTDGEVWDWESLPREERTLLEDYRLLQYDLLLGRQYALRENGAAP
jgi:hypothetical protein